MSKTGREKGFVGERKRQRQKSSKHMKDNNIDEYTSLIKKKNVSEKNRIKKKN